MSDTAGLFASQLLRPQNGPMRDQIADIIEDLILTSKLGPGDQLPSERDLAKLFGISRTPVREGIRLLEQRGLLEMKTGSGTYVLGIDANTVADSIERYCSLVGCSHQDIMAVRKVLEPEIAATAAVRATQEDLTALRELVDTIEDTFLAGEMDEFAASDTGFHVSLAVASHNDAMVAIMTGLHRVVRTWMATRGRLTRIERGARSHRSVYDAVARRDPVLARMAMVGHMAATPTGGPGWSDGGESSDWPA